MWPDLASAPKLPGDCLDLSQKSNDVHVIIFPHWIFSATCLRFNKPAALGRGDLKQSLSITCSHEFSSLGSASQEELVCNPLLHFLEPGSFNLSRSAIRKFDQTARKTDCNGVTLTQLAFIDVLEIDLIVRRNPATVARQPQTFCWAVPITI